MRAEIVQHIHDRRPDLDVLGKWIMLANSKTASKSIMRGVLDDRQIRYKWGARSWSRLWNKVIVPEIDRLVIFTIVRNPWDRAVSAFHYLQQRGTIAKSYSFGQYVKEVLGAAVSASTLDYHFVPQHSSFVCGKYPIPGIVVARFETLAEDWRDIAARINAPRTLPHQNESQHGPYAEYYDDETREIVRRLYAVEIEALGYEFGQ